MSSRISKKNGMNNETDIELHPWEPFVPEGSKILIMGTFPPQRKRWGMDFYYPNRTNDFWFMMGLIFFGDRYALFDKETKSFNLDSIRNLLTDKRIALHDSCRRIRRLKGNASDKFLEVVEPVPLYDLLKDMPECHTIATTGEKAASVIASITGTGIPKMGEYITSDDGLRIWRMPSTSRAYPLRLEEKARFYELMFKETGL